MTECMFNICSTCNNNLIPPTNGGFTSLILAAMDIQLSGWYMLMRMVMRIVWFTFDLMDLMELMEQKMLMLMIIVDIQLSGWYMLLRMVMRIDWFIFYRTEQMLMLRMIYMLLLRMIYMWMLRMIVIVDIQLSHGADVNDLSSNGETA